MSSWRPLYLRAPNYTAMMNALDAAGLVRVDQETGDQVIAGDLFRIRVTLLGILRAPTGETLTDPGGFEYLEMGELPGYHVNALVHPNKEATYRTLLSAVLLDPEPVTPLVSWMGY